MNGAALKSQILNSVCTQGRISLYCCGPIMQLDQTIVLIKEHGDQSLVQLPGAGLYLPR